jgi:hypothetical protein
LTVATQPRQEAVTPAPVKFIVVALVHWFTPSSCIVIVAGVVSKVVILLSNAIIHGQANTVVQVTYPAVSKLVILLSKDMILLLTISIWLCNQFIWFCNQFISGSIHVWI